MKITLFIKSFKNLLKYLLLVVILSCVITYIRFRIEKSNKSEFTFEEKTRKVNEKMKGIKYILVWTEGYGVDWEFLKNEDTTFIENKCEYKNCYVTTNRKYFGRDYTKFDAILFISQFIAGEGYRVPRRRSQKQLYIFASRDSSASYPVCDPKFDGFFNMTWTYKLNSDIPWPYFTVYNLEKKVVAPRTKVDWVKTYEPALDEYGLLVAEKENLAIWIASNCFTISKREALFNRLHFALKRKYLKVDTVGLCGSTQCPLDLENDCLRNMYKYYFFFAFENSLAEDYVSEKVVKAIRNLIVPVVYGDADYDKFLPPHSYINAMTLGADKTVKLMEHLMKDNIEYLDYFRWRNHYYVKQNNKHVCKLCELLNKDVVKVYDNFRNWWNPKSLKSYDSVDKKIC